MTNAPLASVQPERFEQFFNLATEIRRMIYVVLIQDGASVLTEYTKSYRGNRTQQASVPRTKFCYIAHEYKYGDYMLVNRAMRLEFLDAMGCRDCRVVFHQPMHTLQARSDLNFKLFIPYSAVNIHTIKMKIGNERECFTWRGQNWATILYKLFEWTENPLCRIQNVEIDRQMEGSQDIRAYSFPTNKLAIQILRQNIFLYRIPSAFWKALEDKEWNGQGQNQEHEQE